jgi:hypothetical protein
VPGLLLEVVKVMISSWLDVSVNLYPIAIDTKSLQEAFTAPPPFAPQSLR